MTNETLKVQPAKPTCFWCSKEKTKPEDVAKFEEYQKAHLPWKHFQPEISRIFYEPCDECRAKMEKGIPMIGTTQTAPDARPLITPNSYPIGYWDVMAEKDIPKNWNKDRIKYIFIGHRMTKKETYPNEFEDAHERLNNTIYSLVKKQLLLQRKVV